MAEPKIINKSKMMKHLKIFESWLESTVSMIDENTQAAKTFMLKRAADRLRKQVNELTPEEQQAALNDPKFKEVIDLLGDANRGYTGAFTNFIFLQRVPLDRLKLLLNRILQNREFINSLPHTIDVYSKGNPDQTSTVSGFEALMDAFDQIEFARKGKWIINELPSNLKQQARALPQDQQQVLLRLGGKIADEGEEIKTRLMRKVSRYRTIEDFIKYATEFADSYSDNSADKLAAEAQALAPSVNVLYDDDRYVVLSIRTEAAQKALCSAANWCINQWAWKQYSNGAVQINIFDFGVPSTDPLHITGTTIYYSGKVRTSHDINDRHIQKSQDPAQHFEGLGYPPEVVEAIVKPLQAECAVKEVLDANSEKDPKKVLGTIMTAGHKLQIADPELAKYAEREIIAVVDQELGEEGRFKYPDIFETFKQFGVLSIFAAKMYNKIIPGSAISEADKEAILAKTKRGLELMERSKDTWENPVTRAKVHAILAAKDQILSMIEGSGPAQTN